MSVETELFDAAEAVHDELGHGFTESVYHAALLTELSNRGIETSTETTIPVFYKGHSVGRRRPDLMVTDGSSRIVVELKAGSKSGEAQLLQYLDLLGEDNNFNIGKGVLIQFNSDLNIDEVEIDNS